MARLLGNVHVWIYSDVDEAIWNWCDDWAVTMPSSNYTSGSIYKVFSVPSRAFSTMKKILESQLRKSGSVVPAHGAEIPLPFISIYRGANVDDVRRDLPDTNRRYKAQQIRCTVCGRIVSLKNYDIEGLCPYCGAIFDDDPPEFIDYPSMEKTEEELLEDEWHYLSSDIIQQPFDIPYTIDLWCKNAGEYLYICERFRRQFCKDYHRGSMYLDVDYPDPLGTIGVRVDTPNVIDNSELERGEKDRFLRYTFTFNVRAWLHPAVLRIYVVKTLGIDAYHLITNERLFTIPNAFTFNEES